MRHTVVVTDILSSTFYWVKNEDIANNKKGTQHTCAQVVQETRSEISIENKNKKCILTETQQWDWKKRKKIVEKQTQKPKNEKIHAECNHRDH